QQPAPSYNGEHDTDMNSETVQPPDGSHQDNLAIHTRDLHFRWQNQSRELAFPDIHLPRGKHLFLHGPSGTGKSTLLGLLAGMHTHARAGLHLRKQDRPAGMAGALDGLRVVHLVVIFQQFHLVPYLSALANALLPRPLSNLRLSRPIPATT